jgi:hypothetical protein
MPKGTSDIIVIGSGYSLKNLSQEEIDYINGCDLVFALNKYVVFYEKLNILPSHVYFVDMHANSLKFLNYIFEFCANKGLEGIIFILNKKLDGKVYRSKIDLYQINIRRIILNSFSNKKNKFIAVLSTLKKLWKLAVKTDWYLGGYFILPKNCSVQFVTCSGMLEDVKWAGSLDETLFHFRTSFTSLLNYISIKYPGRDIKLVGTDFNKGEYFFQEELDKLKLEWRDSLWDATVKNDKHFAVQKFKGTNMMDKMDYVTANLKKTGNKIFCCNPDSLLVKKQFVSHKKIKD